MNKVKIILLFFFFTVMAFAQKMELQNWNFYTEKDSVIQKVQLPHTWNIKDAFDDEPGYWRGKGIYFRNITIKDISKVYYLHFYGANQITTVWINNQLVGKHNGGYTAFDILISPHLTTGNNQIKVQVDNSHQETVPPLDADFTFYGGIYRKVELVEENPIHFKKEYGAEAVKVDAFLDDKLQGKLSMTSSIKNPPQDSLSIKISIFDSDNNTVFNTQEKILDTINFQGKIKDPKLWSPENPNLYLLKLILLNDKNQIVDSYQHEIGFRKFEVSTSAFKLNNQPLKLVGVNRHQDWKGLGNAVPVEKQIRDLVTIKEMGSNFLRLAHYPQDEAIYKTADSLGLIIWSEIPIVNKVPATKEYSEYEKNAIQMQREHIAQNYNHPSLVFVGYMNEIFLRMVFDKPKEQQKIIENTLKLAEKLEVLTRSEAPNHITVMALHGNQIYNETGIADIPMVIGWNLYYGWYEGEIDDLGTFLDSEFRKFSNRPLIISEYGVGADVRLHNDTSKKFDFSEEYQLNYHRGYWQQLMERDFIIGMAAWNFADFGSEFRGDAMPHINQKGLVNFDRSPKNIYFWYKSILDPDKKLTKIYRDFPIHINESRNKEIKIISNQEVITKLNGIEVNTTKPKDGLIDLTLKLKKGKNKIMTYNNKSVLQDSLTIEWWSPDFNEIKYIAINFGMESYFMDDENRIWIPAKELSFLKITGNQKKIVNNANIKATQNDPLYQTAISNIEAIEIVVPKGKYKLKLLFSKWSNGKSLVYELNEKKDSTYTNSKHEINLKINEKIVDVEKMETFQKKDKIMVIEVIDKIHIKRTNNQSFSICGIVLEKISN